MSTVFAKIFAFIPDFFFQHFFDAKRTVFSPVSAFPGI